jgi:hypothetical protein
MGYMKIKPVKVHARWEKHTYVNQTKWNVQLIDSRDQQSHLTVVPAMSSVTPPSSYNKRSSRTIYITDGSLFVDMKGERWVLCPED